jgi:hypothetical protein
MWCGFYGVGGKSGLNDREGQKSVVAGDEPESSGQTTATTAAK